MQCGIIFYPLTMQKLEHNCTSSSSPSSKASFGNSLLCKFDFDHLPKEILTYKYKHHKTFYISNIIWNLKLTILMTKFTIKPLNSCRGTWWIIISDCSISLQQQTRYMTWSKIVVSITFCVKCSSTSWIPLSRYQNFEFDPKNMKFIFSVKDTQKEMSEVVPVEDAPYKWFDS